MQCPLCDSVLEEVISLKHCTLDTCGVRVLCLCLLHRLDYALLCCYWFCPLLLFSTRLRAVQSITLQKQFRSHQKHQQFLEEAESYSPSPSDVSPSVRVQRTENTKSASKMYTNSHCNSLRLASVVIRTPASLISVLDNAIQKLNFKNTTFEFPDCLKCSAVTRVASITPKIVGVSW